MLSNIDSWIWVAILVISIIIEALTLGLATIWSAIAALPMIFIARTNMPFKWQVLIFLVITVILIVFTRPFVVKKLKTGRNKTNVSTMLGQEVLVTKKVSQFQKGEAKASNGVIWTVKANDDSSEIKEDLICTVVAIEGNTLIIEPSESKNITE